jgi:GTPase SAR1 family protein
MTSNKYDFKITMIGDEMVGKTSLIQKLKTVPIKNNTTLHYFEVSGRGYLKKSSYKSSNAIVIVFDLSSIESYRGIQYWIEQIRFNSDISFIILVGHKSDLESCIDEKTIANFCKNHLNVKYIKTSSVKKENITELYDLIINCIHLYKRTENFIDNKDISYSTFETVPDTVKFIPHEKKKITILDKLMMCFKFNN